MCDAVSDGRVVGDRSSHRGGGDHLADSGYSDGVYRRADGGGYVGRVRRERGERKGGAAIYGAPPVLFLY